VSLYNEAFSFFEAGDLESSRNLLVQGTRRFPLDEDFWYHLGGVLSDLGDFTGAIDSYTGALRLSDDSLVERGFCFEQIGNFSAAEADYQAALNADDEDVSDKSCYAPLAVMLANDDDLEDALVAVRLAIIDGDTDLTDLAQRVEGALEFDKAAGASGSLGG